MHLGGLWNIVHGYVFNFMELHLVKLIPFSTVFDQVLSPKSISIIAYKHIYKLVRLLLNVTPWKRNICFAGNFSIQKSMPDTDE